MIVELSLMKRWVHKASAMLSTFILYSDPHLLTCAPAHPLNKLSAPAMFSGAIGPNLTFTFCSCPLKTQAHKWDSTLRWLKLKTHLLQISLLHINHINTQIHSICVLIISSDTSRKDVLWDYKTDVQQQTLDLTVLYVSLLNADTYWIRSLPVYVLVTSWWVCARKDQ